MIEIKFRGKSICDKRFGEWIYGYYLPDFDGYTHRTLIVDCISGLSEEVNPVTVGQFTGLLDKNNNEIYDGDILNNGQCNYSVRWNKERGAWWLRNKDHIYVTPLGFLSKELFIIGSVYDNPK